MGLVLAAGCVQQHETTLHFAHYSVGADAGFSEDLPSGFHCDNTNGLTGCALLFLDGGACIPNPVRTNPTVSFNVVVDFLTGVPPGVPDTYEMFGLYCDTDAGLCPLAPGTRRCFPVTLLDAGLLYQDNEVAPAVTAALQAFDGGIISTDAPGGTVVVRAVSTHESCPPESQTRFALDQLVGCAHSQPVVLKDLENVELELYTNSPANYGECTLAYCANASGCYFVRPDGG